MIHSTKYMQAYVLFSYYLFPFSFICVQMEREILSQKFSVTDCFPYSLNT